MTQQGETDLVTAGSAADRVLPICHHRPVRVRVATYNILRGGRRRAVLDDTVRRLDVDVLLVNETPKAPIVWRWAARRLVRRWGLRLVAGGRPAGSNLIAAAPYVRVMGAGAEVLPQPWFRPRRGIAWAQLEVGGQSLGVVSCHLSLDRARRVVEVARVLEVARERTGTVVVGGDLNEPPAGPCWRALRQAGFVDAGSDEWPTYPADGPLSRIDALLFRGSAHVVHHGDPGVPVDLLARASDHRPVVLDLVQTGS